MGWILPGMAQQIPFAAARWATARERMNHNARDRKLLLPGALLVTIQAQLLAAFVLVDFCLAAFF
jgi:hypothetical protein